MIRLAVSLFASLLIAGQALAATTWSSPVTGSKAVKASCTTGTETLTQPSGTWAVGTTYAADVVLIYQGAPYVSLQADNVGHNPAEASSAWWRIVGVDVYLATALEVTICADVTASAYVSDGAGFDVYVWDPAIGLWALFTATPYTAPVGAAGKPCSSLQGDSPAIGIPILFNAQGVRMAVVPTAAATSNLGSSHPMLIWHRVKNASGAML